jgi:FhuF 2Fe-2S C-terminal domain
VSAVQAGPAVARAAIAAAAATGPFFELAIVDASTPGQWRPCEQGLAGLAAAYAGRLGTREPRVTASILHLDAAARLWSPVLACGLLRGVVPDLSGLLVTAGSPLRFGIRDPAAWAAPSPAGLAELSAAAVEGQLRRIAAALPARLTAGLLRGNSASAMTGALGELVRANPRLAGPARQLAGLLLSTPGLRGSGDLTDAALSFRRRSCCLYYRVPGGGLCGDCCLDRPPASEPRRGGPAGG